MAYIHATGNYEKEQSTNTANSVGELPKHSAEGKRPDTEDCTLHDLTDVKSLEKAELRQQKAGRWLPG